MCAAERTLAVTFARLGACPCPPRQHAPVGQWIALADGLSPQTEAVEDLSLRQCFIPWQEIMAAIGDQDRLPRMSANVGLPMSAETDIKTVDNAGADLDTAVPNPPNPNFSDWLIMSGLCANGSDDFIIGAIQYANKIRLTGRQIDRHWKKRVLDY
jgi:hypothetical protein